jgi:hypothetical protein
VILTLWLLLLGVLFLGRWPGGTPPAWRTGQAEPWPAGGEDARRRRRNPSRWLPARRCPGRERRRKRKKRT